MNSVTLSVAGARKTQSIADACAKGDPNRRRLALTYTLAGQAELRNRLATTPALGAAPPDVMGWYSFLLNLWVRPYLPRLWPGRRVEGFNFDGDPGRFATGYKRHFDGLGRAYRVHLAKLASEVDDATKGSAVDRIGRMYDEIYVDEVQDLTGWDLEILSRMMTKGMIVTLVGDVRQSVIETNPRDPKFRQFRGLRMLEWFALLETKKLITVHHEHRTWRSHQSIATFADSIFKEIANFPATESLQSETTGHDGVFALGKNSVSDYVETFDPVCLRASKATPGLAGRPIYNFGAVKGRTFQRVLIFPTNPTIRFLTTRTPLPERSACGLYVGVTRACHSVAFVVPDPQAANLPVWSP